MIANNCYLYALVNVQNYSLRTDSRHRPLAKKIVFGIVGNGRACVPSWCARRSVFRSLPFKETPMTRSTVAAMVKKSEVGANKLSIMAGAKKAPDSGGKLAGSTCASTLAAAATDQPPGLGGA
jgi:hypothetical protein